MPKHLKREKIGSFCVDTGTILMADPCQVVPESKKKARWTYKDILGLFYTQGTTYTEPAIVHDDQVLFPAQERTQRAEHVTLRSETNGVTGIVITVGVDGWYPVYLERNADGTPKRIIIECGGKVKP